MIQPSVYLSRDSQSKPSFITSQMNSWWGTNKPTNKHPNGLMDELRIEVAPF